MKDLRPDLAAIFWDGGLPAKRVELQPAYKQQREAMPEKMIPQLDFIRDFCAPMGFISIEKPDTEADDLMGCYAVAAGNKQIETILATNDKDLFQLVSDSVKVYSTNKSRSEKPERSARSAWSCGSNSQMGGASGTYWRGIGAHRR